MNQILVLDDDRIDAVREYTGGAMDPCYQCGTCTASCPHLSTKGQNDGIRGLMRSAQLGLETNGLTWQCTACGSCEAKCPRGVGIVETIMGLRARDFHDRRTPAEMHDLLWSVVEEGNSWGQPRSHRAAWTKGLDVPVGQQANTLLYVGCANSYDPRLQAVTRGLASTMGSIGADYTVLGDAEKCCGDSIRATGERAYLERLIDENVASFNATGADQLVTISPHCYDIMKNLYPQHGLEAEVLHYTEYLERLLDAGQLKPKRFDGQVAYHDPCYLGRHNGLYETPRRLLENVPGLELVEMPNNKQNAVCCGGGGGGMWREGDGERLSDRRMVEAKDAAIETLATTCGYCIQNFEDSGKRVGGPKVLDVMELLGGGA